MVTPNIAFDFGTLPRDYGDVRAEARSCRSAAALFDFSFMSRLRIEGSGASALIAKLTARRVDDLPSGRIRYAPRIDDAGHVLGDLTIWRLDADCFEVFSGTHAQVADVMAFAGPMVSVRELGSDTAILAVQGPGSLRALCAAGLSESLRELSYFSHMSASIAGVPCRIGRLGYTGERGFEIVLPRDARETVWTQLAEHARPAGFAAADLLRIEAGFILFSNELRFPVSPRELGLDRFAGDPADRTAAQNPEQRVRLLCFRAMSDFEPILWQPSHSDASFPPSSGEIVVTSACRSILTGGVLGLGYALAGPEVPPLRDASGRFRDICEVSLPFYDPTKRIPRGAWSADLSPDRGSLHSFQ
jgi:glycine cleavage system aminomethyltransferase T